MQHVAIYIFFSSALFVAYVLFGYPIILWILSATKTRAVRKLPSQKTVTIILPVHNGEGFILEKLASISKLDYPTHLVEVLVIDDGSTDATARRVGEWNGTGVRLISVPRGGKAAALNCGISQARGEILVFTDVRQTLDRHCLRHLIDSMADPAVGVVSSEIIILSGETQQEADIGLYWRYEKWMRRRLSQIGSVLGATGCLYALRRDLAVRVPPDMLLDDVYLPLAAFFKGYRAILDPSAVAYDYPTVLRSEFKRKVRTQAGVYQIIWAYPRLLLPTTQMWFHFGSHKLGRLLLPFALILLAASTPGLPGDIRIIATVGQAALYGMAAIDGFIPASWRLKRVSSIARTFVVLVAAAFCAPFFLISKARRSTGWSTTEVRRAAPADLNHL
jgi:cellulose synthase/poly-beta-1,6-N-acetylglucosamine synthase-like glycosyltransferase